MQKLKVKTPRLKAAFDSTANEKTTVGEVADSVAERASYGGSGGHTLSHDGRILQREFRVLEVINFHGAKPRFELVLR